MAEKHEHSNEYRETRHNKKKWPIVLGIIFSVVIILAILLYFLVFHISTPIGTLNILSGTAQVDTGLGYATATDGMSLKQGYSIKTLDSSNARIVLLDSVILTLDPNSEIKLDTLGKNTVVSLTSGDAWSKFMLGDVQQYTVSVLGTTAVAYGTSFNTKIAGNDVILTVSDGTVGFSNSVDNVQAPKGSKYIMSGGRITESSLTPEEKSAVVASMNNDLGAIKDLRFEMMQRNKAAYNQLKNMFNKTDDNVQKILDLIDNGELNDTEMISKSPIKLPMLQKLGSIDTEVKKQQASISKLQASQ